MQNLKEAARNLQPQLVEWRRWCHQHPGIGYEVEETAEYIAQKLRQWDIEVETGVGKSGVVGIVRGAKPGPVIGIRADMDALPVTEANEHEYVSKYPGKMHACGHDGHVAMALGAAKLLAEMRQDLSGTFVIIFQPAEEGLGGAKAMIDDGVLSRHKVQAIVGGHLGLIAKELTAGQVGVCYGPMMAATYSFEANVIGKGGHGAMPHETVDPIVIAAEVVSAWQRIVSREISPLHPAVLTVGKIQGGSTHNIIPPQVDMLGTIRYFHQPAGDKLRNRMEQVLANICKAWGAEYNFSYGDGYPPVVNDKQFTQLFAETAEVLVGSENVVELTTPTMGGEDMSFFLQQVPGTFFFLGAGNPDKGIVYPHHHPKFDLDEDVLWMGTALLAGTALEYTKK
ncbi:MAG: amidohydrolase [Firmicutes bacterium]|nr:amidohydrolase [Bacillota bacterium]